MPGLFDEAFRVEKINQKIFAEKVCRLYRF